MIMLNTSLLAPFKKCEDSMDDKLEISFIFLVLSYVVSIWSDPPGGGGGGGCGAST